MAVISISILLLTGIVRAAAPALSEQQQQCVSAYVDAQKLRRDGKLRAAYEKLLACSQEDCPQTLRSQCVPWLDEVERSLPSVVFAAFDRSGAETTQVRIELDGQPWLASLPARGVAVDPGEHRLRYVAADGTAVERTLIVREGEKNRQVEIRFAPARPGSAGAGGAASAPAAAAAGSGPLLWPAVAAGGLGVLALGSFTGFGLTGKLKESELVSTCAPNCARSDVDDVQTRFLVADISLLTALVCGAVGGGLLVANLVIGSAE